MTRYKIADDDPINEIAERLTTLGCSPTQVERHTEQLRVADQPKPKKPTEPSREPVFDGWCSGVAR